MLNRLRRRVAQRLRRRRTAVPPVPPAEVQAFLTVARESFLQMQAAWDRADVPALARLATAPLLDDLREQLAQRGPEPNCTEVLELRARLLALEELAEAFVASVEFTGLIRERREERAAPFKEMWLLANVKAADAGWRLARVQSLS